MRAWAEMFGAFLAGWRGPGDASPYTDADYFAHVDGKPRYDGVRDLLAARGIDLPDGDPSDPPAADTVCGLGNRKNDAFNAVLARDGVTAYPGSVALLDRLRDLRMPVAVVSSSANAPAVLAAAGLADRFPTVVDGRVATALGLPGKPAPDTFVHAATELRRDPGRVRSSSRTPSRACGPARRVASGWSSASTAAPAPTPLTAAGADPRRQRPRRTCAVRPRRGPRPTRSTAAASPSTRGAWSSRDPDPHDLGVTETLFSRRQRLPRHARQPRGGPRRLRARHLRQRLPRDLADPARRGRLRLRQDRPDHRQRPRRQADEALRRRRAARPRHRRPRALRAHPRLPRRRPAPLAALAHAVGQAGAGRLHPDGVDDPAAPRRVHPRGHDGLGRRTGR